MEYNGIVMTLTEIADYLKLSEKTVLKMIKELDIPCTKIGNQWRFLKELIDNWLIKQMTTISKDNLSQLIEQDVQTVPLSRLMNLSLITFFINKVSKKEIIAKLVLLAKNKNIISDEDYVCDKLLERENLTSTAIGKGIALPHLREPSNKIVHIPKIVIGVCRKGIDFNSLDKKPTFLIFLILTDNEIVHLRVMAKLMYVLKDEIFIRELMESSNPADVLQLFINYEHKNSLNMGEEND